MLSTRTRGRLPPPSLPQGHGPTSGVKVSGACGRPLGRTGEDQHTRAWETRRWNGVLFLAPWGAHLGAVGLFWGRSPRQSLWKQNEPSMVVKDGTGTAPIFHVPSSFLPDSWATLLLSSHPRTTVLSSLSPGYVTHSPPPELHILELVCGRQWSRYRGGSR